MLKNKQIALVTGSSKGLGRAIAAHLARKGYFVVVHYNQSKNLAEELQNQIIKEGGQAVAMQADVTDPSSVKALFERIESSLGGLDVLINNVGDYLKKNVSEVSLEEWHLMLNSNLNSVFYCIHYALPLLKRTSGESAKHIINIGYASLGQATAKVDVAPYYIAKNGALTLTKSFAASLAESHINVNMLSPGVLENSESKPVHEIPKGRVATFEELLHVLDMLLSPNGQYLTGINIEIAGGWKL